MKKYLIIFTVVYATTVFPQEQARPFANSAQARTHGDTAGYVRLAREAFDKSPFDMWRAYDLARAYAMNGEKRKCIEILDDISVYGFYFDINSDDGFKKVWNHSFVKKISARARKAAFTYSGVTAFTVREKDLVPEGLAYDLRRNIFYISSIYKRKVVAIYPDGSVKDAIPEAQDGLLSTIGLRVDAARNQLWVLSAMQPAYARMMDTKEIGKSRIHQYDLGSMQLMAMVEPADTNAHFFNDLSITASGDVYLTDSEQGCIYKVDAKNGTLLKWYSGSDLSDPNGITISPDQQYLFVAHRQGISRISIADTQSVLLRTKLKTTMAGIDGLYFYDNALIAVQNGAGPQSRIMRYDLNKNLDIVTKATVLESGHPDHAIPTTGTIVGDDFYYIANSQLQSFDANGKIFPPEKLQPIHILKLSLNK